MLGTCGRDRDVCATAAAQQHEALTPLPSWATRLPRGLGVVTVRCRRNYIDAIIHIWTSDYTDKPHQSVQHVLCCTLFSASYYKMCFNVMLRVQIECTCSTLHSWLILTYYGAAERFIF